MRTLGKRHIAIVGQYLWARVDAPPGMVRRINAAFVEAGLKPVYTLKRLNKALSNRRQRVRRRSEILPHLRTPPTTAEVESALGWVEDEERTMGSRGVKKVTEEEADVECLQDWPCEELGKWDHEEPAEWLCGESNWEEDRVNGGVAMCIDAGDVRYDARVLPVFQE